MKKKDAVVKVTVNNAGFDYEDDVDFVIMTFPTETDFSEVEKAIAKADKELREEDDEGECLYNEEGWNYITLMNKVCEEHGWSWQQLNPEISFTIG